MRKLFFLLACIIGLLTYVGCSQEDSTTDIQISAQTQKNEVRWYGVKTPDAIQTRGVVDQSKLWSQRVPIAIKFINEPSDPKLIKRIKTIASEWESYADIKFDYVKSDKKANVRIAFDWNGNNWLTWSYTGTDAKFEEDQSKPTAVFGGLQNLNPLQMKGDILRVFGQILGLEYEQRHQRWSFWNDETQLETYWQDQFKGMNMDWAQIKDFVFTPLTGNNAIYPYMTPKVDELSVMAWPYYTADQTSKLLTNNELSVADKEFIAKLYPKNINTLPIIQEAWVDAGYFTWTNASKTALRITAFGAEQEILPDVSDGQQLTSAISMFQGATKLIEAPDFNTSNITHFSNMFNNCPELTSLPVYNTSKGIIFSKMFYRCTSLIAIPAFETSSGTNFEYMFYGCASLLSIPQLNTSNGTTFKGMFHVCTSLETVPQFDLSKGTIFYGMFNSCTELKETSQFDTSNGTDFSLMFNSCKKLTKAPQLITSNGTLFNDMFKNCRSLQEKPNLDLSKATDTSNIYYGTPFAKDPL